MKERLAGAIMQCMKTTAIEKITVQQIVEVCGTTRQTFYRYFQDKYDLINRYFEMLLLESFAQMGKGAAIYEGLVKKFRFIKQEQEFFKKAFKLDEKNCLKEYDFHLILQFYTDRTRERTGKPLEEDMQFLKNWPGCFVTL